MFFLQGIIRDSTVRSRGRAAWKCLSPTQKMGDALVNDWGCRLLLHMKVGPVPKPQKQDPHPERTVNRKRNLLVLQEWGMSTEGLEELKRKRKLAELSTGALVSKLCWLERFFGFSRRRVARIVRSYPLFLGLSMDENVRPFMELLRSEGPSPADIRKVVVSAPRMLGRAKKFSFIENRLEKHLRMNRQQVVTLVLKCPGILFASGFDLGIAKMVETFAEMGLGVDSVSLMVCKFPELLLMSLEGDLQVILKPYADLGLSSLELRNVLTEAPSLLGKNFRIFVQDKLTFLTEEAGFGQKEALHLLVQDPRKFRDSLKVWRSTHRWILAKGMGLESARDFLQKNMNFLSRNCRALEEKHKFAMEVLGKSSEEILRCPRYFNSSFEDIILFRTAFLRNNGDDYTQRALGHMVSSNGIFNKRHGYDEIECFRKTWTQLTREQKLAQCGQQ